MAAVTFIMAFTQINKLLNQSQITFTTRFNIFDLLLLRS